MDALERLKRKVVSRLTGEPDVIYFDKNIDSKVAKLTYKDREIIVEERKGGFVLFLGHRDDYTFSQDYLAGRDKEGAINDAKEIIKRDEGW